MKNDYKDPAEIKITQMIKHAQAIPWFQEDTIPQNQYLYDSGLSTVNNIWPIFLALKIYNFMNSMFCIVSLCTKYWSRCYRNELNINSELEGTGHCTKEDFKWQSGSETNNMSLITL